MPEPGRALPPISVTLRRQAVPLALSAASLAAYGALAWLHLARGTLRGPVTPQTLVCYAAAFAAFLGLLVWAEKRGPVSMPLVWMAAVAFRVVLLATTPTLSDDVYRYLWDGHVAVHGLSPYRDAVAAPALDFLDTPLRARVNHPEMASPYLPAAQVLFAAVTVLSPHPVAFQAAMVLLDLATALLLAGLLAWAALPRRRLLLYLWHPLVIVESAHGAHVDAWMVFLTMLAVWLALAPGRFSHGRRSWLAPAVLAAATMTKPLPLLLVPVFLPRWRWRGLAVLVGAMILFLLPAGLAGGWGLAGPLDGRGLFGALQVYGRYWTFNSGVYDGLVRLLSALDFPAPDLWARGLTAASLLAVLIAVWRKSRVRTAPQPFLRLLAVPFMAWVLLTPTLHPWYLVILLAFLPFVAPPGAGSAWLWLDVAPWLYLSAAIVLSYLSYLDPAHFRELDWVRAVEWWPTYGLLLVGCWAARRKGSPAAPSASSSG